MQGKKCIQIIALQLRCDLYLFLVHDKFVPQMDETDTFITLRLIIIKLFIKISKWKCWFVEWKLSWSLPIFVICHKPN